MSTRQIKSYNTFIFVNDAKFTKLKYDIHLPMKVSIQKIYVREKIPALDWEN